MGRIAVIGAGVVGACVAYYLVREGADVLLVDAGDPGAMTTSASFAWVNASAKAEHDAYFELNFAGLREYGSLVSEVGDSGWWHHTGHLRWDYRDEHEVALVVSRLHARGYPAEVWEADRARRLLEPNVEFRPAGAPVVLLPAEAWIDGPRMVRALIDTAVCNGMATAFGSAVHAIAVNERAVCTIELDSGDTYAVDHVVNAAGPMAARVAALIGRHLPMLESSGLAVRIETGGDWVRHVLHAPGTAIRPDGPRRAFVLGRSVESELADSGHSSRLAEEVKRAAGRVVEAFATATVTDVRVGRRPIPADGFPAIGKASEVDGYYEAVMHSGITLAPVVARTLAAEILRREVDPLVAGFRASRLGGN